MEALFIKYSGVTVVVDLKTGSSSYLCDLKHSMKSL